MADDSISLPYSQGATIPAPCATTKKNATAIARIYQGKNLADSQIGRAGTRRGRISSLFNKIELGFEQPDTTERHRLFRQLKRELDIHAAVEDLHVYRVFQQAESTRDEAYGAVDAHSKIKTLLDEVDTKPVYDPQWVPRFQGYTRSSKHMWSASAEKI